MEGSRINKLDTDGKKNHPYKSYEAKKSKRDSKKNEDYTVLDDTTAPKTKIRSKSRIHSIHRIPDKAELDKMSNSLISNYFPTRDNVQNSDQSEQPVNQMLNQTESLCSLP